jgi:hypothetical protein
MVGLLEPTSGEVLVDGLPLSTMGVRAFREQVAAVMQEDRCISPDGQRVATASRYGAHIWDVDTGAMITVLEHQDDVERAAFHPDGRRVLTACRDGSARLWDLETGAVLTGFRQRWRAPANSRLQRRRSACCDRLARQDGAHLGCRHRPNSRRPGRAL